jgi:tetracycline 7-halogenase / FADH2 O2-dependent halogenase
MSSENLTRRRLEVDVAILGAGLGGSLLALVLERIGLRTALIERGRHPRFALGESSTPLAGLALAELSRHYDLPRIAPLAEFGTWQATYPELTCGLKRGFSYFHHQPGIAWSPRPDHANELLVAASHAAADADTHWLRSGVDHFLLTEALAAGTAYLDRAEIDGLSGGPPWTLSATREGERSLIEAQFLVDASGEGRVLSKALAIGEHANGLRTSSRAIYGHFRDVRPWRDLLNETGADVADHPFNCDDAALHHVFDGGWMWVLRFNNGVTSAGWMIDHERFPLDESPTPGDEWTRWLTTFPTIARQFADAHLVDPPGGLRRTGRRQRRASRTAGTGWAMLPLSAYSLDALHSTGNAHTLSAIERLAAIFERSWRQPRLAEELACYDAAIQAEISLIDTLVAGCYRGMRQPALFAAFAMFYFAAATTCEARRRAYPSRPAAFLLADDAPFCSTLEAAYQRIVAVTRDEHASASAVAAFDASVADALRPYNSAGLCDPARRNMYPYLP